MQHCQHWPTLANMANGDSGDLTPSFGRAFGTAEPLFWAAPTHANTCQASLAKCVPKPVPHNLRHSRHCSNKSIYLAINHARAIEPKPNQTTLNKPTALQAYKFAHFVAFHLIIHLISSHLFSSRSNVAKSNVSSARNQIELNPTMAMLNFAALS